jgi:hypothetical protein
MPIATPTITIPPMTITAGKGGESYSSIPSASVERMVIRNGYLTLVVDDVSIALSNITALAAANGGFVVNSNIQEDQNRLYGNISFRVDAKQFNDTIQALRNMAVDVKSESTTGEDVTEQYTDLNSQLRNLEASEAQLLDLMKRAGTVDEILNVQRELTNTRGQIEQIKGRIQYLERTSDMALIDVNLQKTKPIGGTAWSALETLKSAARGLVTFGKVLADVLIWVAIFSPIWIIILVVVLYYTRWRKAKVRTSRK